MMSVSERLKKPAIGLILVSFLNLLIWLRLFERLITLRGEWTTQGFTARWMNILFLTLPDTLHIETLPVGPVMVSLKIGMVMSLIIFYGAAHMMAGRRYYLAFSCSVLVMVPVLSPLFVLGIPVGLWSLSHLRVPGVASEMNTSAE